VQLPDEDTGDLVVRAACGIEEDVRQGVRVPAGSRERCSNMGSKTT
jgi:hypothetical protein